MVLCVFPGLRAAFPILISDRLLRRPRRAVSHRLHDTARVDVMHHQNPYSLWTRSSSPATHHASHMHMDGSVNGLDGHGRKVVAHVEGRDLEYGSRLPLGTPTTQWACQALRSGTYGFRNSMMHSVTVRTYGSHCGLPERG